MEYDLSPQQAVAAEKVAAWLDRHRNNDPKVPQTFKLFGYAGTGKTTLAKMLAGSQDSVMFMAFTAKAAAVMASKGCCPSTTIHQAIYKPQDAKASKLKELKAEEKTVLAEIEASTGPDEVIRDQLREVRRKIRQEEENEGRPFFLLNPDSELPHTDLGCIDEVSMVDEPMGRDLLSFKTPLLVLGDPAQLQPVRGTGYFTTGEPDVLLTEVHRQAEGNPILKLATDVRTGRGLEVCDLGAARVIRGRPTEADCMDADQILCGTNRKRRALNNRVRELKGYTSALPEVGERLVCLRNNYDIGLRNGTIWTCTHNYGSSETGTFLMDVQDENGFTVEGVVVHTAHFEGRDLAQWERRSAEEFDYGYALTVHKAQGSQWDRVTLFDDWPGEGRRQWLYTGVTRAAKELLVVQ